jgi:predicted metal-dependent enzyme (double-stranded beta helix superfamily)
MLKPSFAVALTVLCSLALVSADQRTVGAQDKAQISDVFKDRLAVDDPKLVSVRQYDVPPGWATPMHQHTGHMFLYIVEGRDGDRGSGTSRGRWTGDPSASGQTNDHEECEQLSAAEVHPVPDRPRGAASHGAGAVADGPPR